ncbi:VIR protein [Plasmodium vivax]|uniref:VIR protein n=1 Tax=Plasmodium vivax TaxID=5855 RepID=A0A1G4EGF8_PLAVI|nr:VIR protein [Plasmodium vivax]
MACSNYSGDYFNYHCYDRLKKYYDKPYNSSIANDILNRFQVPPHLKIYLEDSPNLLSELGKNLASYGPYDSAYYHITCNYINYWLNQKIAHIYGLHDSNFKLFLDFADEFGKERSVINYKKNSCSKYFSFLKGDKNVIMKTLYEMYDLYNKIISKNPVLTPKNICSNFMSINYHYNTLIWNYPNDEDLHKKLGEFKNLVLNEKTNHEGKCDTNLSYVMALPIPSPRPPENSDVGERSSVQQVGSQISTDERLKVKSGDPINQPQLQSQAEDTPSTVERQQAKLSQTSEALLSLQGEHPESPLSSRGGKPEAVLSQYPEHQEELQISEFSESTYSPVNFPRKETLLEMNKHTDGINYRSPDTYIPSNQSEGIMHSIKGAFTGIVQSVDPGPVLGVSGGMGALFLLFKYTPVGSFFGGRRGRIRQIPSNFRGFPPGDFANFQEYDGGFIGYNAMNVNPFAE